jgi:hypothetical protein
MRDLLHYTSEALQTLETRDFKILCWFRGLQACIKSLQLEASYLLSSTNHHFTPKNLNLRAHGSSLFLENHHHQDVMSSPSERGIHTPLNQNANRCVHDHLPSLYLIQFSKRI